MASWNAGDATGSNAIAAAAESQSSAGVTSPTSGRRGPPNFVGRKTGRGDEETSGPCALDSEEPGSRSTSSNVEATEPRGVAVRGRFSKVPWL